MKKQNMKPGSSESWLELNATKMKKNGMPEALLGTYIDEETMCERASVGVPRKTEN